MPRKDWVYRCVLSSRGLSRIGAPAVAALMLVVGTGGGAWLGRDFIRLTQPVLAQDAAFQRRQLVVNGTSASVPWQRTEDGIGIADYALESYLGIELLDAPVAGQQPLRWLAESGRQTLTASSWVASGHRYVDVRALASAAGWQLAAEGNRLVLKTPTAQVLRLRRSQRVWGDRLVIDLDAPSLWQLQSHPGEFTLTLPGARAAAAVVDELATIASSPSSASSFIQSTEVLPSADPSQKQFSLRVRLKDDSAQPLVFTLNQPQRLVIDIRRDHVPTRNVAWAPGLQWQQRYLSTGGAAFPTYWLSVDLRQANLSLRPIRAAANTAAGLIPLTVLGEQQQAAAAINGGFFNRNNQYPLGAIRRAGEWQSGPILSRGAVAWNSAGGVLIDRLHLAQSVTLDTGKAFPVVGTNSGYAEAGIALYTPAWGNRYQAITGNEAVVTVIDGVVYRQQLSLSGTSPIPDNGYLMVFRSYRTAAAEFVPGAAVTVAQTAVPDRFTAYENILGGGPLLLKRGNVVLNPGAESFSASFATQAAPRSAICSTTDGRLRLVAVGANSTSRGPTLPQLAQLMMQLGCDEALNLDGGGSSSLYLGGRLLNRSPRTAGRINNALGIFLTSPAP